jgi:hypothetical protein
MVEDVAGQVYNACTVKPCRLIQGTRDGNVVNDVASQVTTVARNIHAGPHRPGARLNGPDDAAGYHYGRRRGLPHRLVRRQRLLHRPVLRVRWKVLATSQDPV